LTEDTPVAHEAEEEHQPKGTIFMMAIFLLLIIGMWVWTYAILLERGS
jgi:hypothetical protein